MMHVKNEMAQFRLTFFLSTKVDNLRKHDYNNQNYMYNQFD